MNRIVCILREYRFRIELLWIGEGRIGKMDGVVNALWGLLALPYMPLLLIGLFVLLLASIVGGVLRLIIRIIFRPIRFAICFLIVLALIALVSYSLYNHPILPDSQDWKGEEVELSAEENALAAVSEMLSGVFTEDLPLLAWRMQTVEAGSASAPEGLYQLGAAQPVYIEVEYLPIGSVTVAYQPLTGQISVVKGIDEGVEGNFLSSLLEPFADAIPMGLAQASGG